MQQLVFLVIVLNMFADFKQLMGDMGDEDAPSDSDDEKPRGSKAKKVSKMTRNLHGKSLRLDLVQKEEKESDSTC